MKVGKKKSEGVHLPSDDRTRPTNKIYKEDSLNGLKIWWIANTGLDSVFDPLLALTCSWVSSC